MVNVRQTLITVSDNFDLVPHVLETLKTIVKIQQRRIGDIFLSFYWKWSYLHCTGSILQSMSSRFDLGKYHTNRTEHPNWNNLCIDINLFLYFSIIINNDISLLNILDEKYI
jgi:hypothetical protein